MRIIRYQIKNSVVPQLGIINNEDIYELKGDVLDGSAKEGNRLCSLKEVKLLAPCLPSKIVCMAINFPGIDHYSPNMKEPMVFIKPGSSICNPGDPVINPFPDLPWWGEAELGVVIRRRMRNINPVDVRDFVLGFTIGNDASVENIEGRDHHLARSKAPDTFCPIGPWIDTDFDTRDCIIEAVQNGEVIRRGRSSQQVWQWPRILSWLSTWITLEPWDIVLTGNPPDTVGMRFINHGDIYTARVEGLGELTNPFFLKGR
ncbi:fumarylacetoacetate hydrolase family protein [bacterium]|nr:fumarylacetoacetate hydrolase family protein [bacterium]